MMLDHERPIPQWVERLLNEAGEDGKKLRAQILRGHNRAENFHEAVNLYSGFRVNLRVGATLQQIYESLPADAIVSVPHVSEQGLVVLRLIEKPRPGDPKERQPIVFTVLPPPMRRY